MIAPPSLIMNTFSRLKPAVALWAAVLLPARVFAVDPLPPDLERAPLEVRARYLQERGKRNLELKRQVAIERYEERARQKRAVITALQDQVRQNYEELVQSSASRASAGTDPVAGESTSPRLWIGLVLAGAGLIVVVRRRLVDDQVSA